MIKYSTRTATPAAPITRSVDAENVNARDILLRIRLPLRFLSDDDDGGGGGGGGAVLVEYLDLISNKFFMFLELYEEEWFNLCVVKASGNDLVRYDLVIM